MAPSTTTAPSDLVLSLSRTTYASHTDLFRVEIFTVGGELPIRIWMESRRSKNQWECTVKNFDEHKPAGTAYSLPPKLILTALMAVLTCTTKRNDETCSEGCEHYNIDLKPISNRRLSLHLTLEAFEGRLQAEFMFILTPREVGQLDVLHAKIRDLEDEVNQLKEENSQLKKSGSTPKFQRLEVGSTHETESYDHIKWNNQARLLPTVVSVNRDFDVLTFHREGLFHIQITGSCSTSSGMLLLYHNDSKVAMASVIKQDEGASTKYLLVLSLVMRFAVNSTIEVCYVAKHPCGHSQCPNGKCTKSKLSKNTKLFIHSLELSPVAEASQDRSAKSNGPKSIVENGDDSDDDDDNIPLKREH
ncbi:unnamed protein product [Aphanomyces euteiches]|uniref:Uncharacterized protein n=1 Tax=Aphanomyces euteiches TaxID=100861 RepID=A0A6G0WVY6_9STRA|nr:hypothetical protein Ae201684_011262 [Aphanomyces euteiches]KAH9058579.1 hypothetical protein Ae201684P_005922 [Aphanomyces euteiches]KAH9155218.1 hypothetical protein AeRB84_002793 [Aphanomyces euteiches]